MSEAPQPDDVGKNYDAIAAEYVRNIYDELKDKPLDRALLDRFASAVRETGLVCDIGTGPGHVARYLQERGVQVCGIDLSTEMITQARRLNPGIEFQQGDMFALDLPNETFAGMTAFYALVNIPREKLIRALRELHRVLKPDGLLLLAFHLGDDEPASRRNVGHQCLTRFLFFPRDEMIDWLRAAGFEIREVIERDPYPEVEHPSRRAYIFARRSRSDNSFRSFPSGAKAPHLPAGTRKLGQRAWRHAEPTFHGGITHSLPICLTHYYGFSPAEVLWNGPTTSATKSTQLARHRRMVTELSPDR